MRSDLRFHLFAAFALLHLTVGCGGDDSSGSSNPPSGGSGGDAGAAGDANGGAGGACEPTTCGELGLGCGDAADGCGLTLHCGDTCAEGGAGGDGGGACDPHAVLATRPTNARHATSSGYHGTDDDYLALFEIACEAPSDCAKSCTGAGGSQTMCAAAECLANGAAGNQCVPAPVWDNLNTIASEDASLDDMCQIVLVNTAYRDTLRVDQFGLSMPSDAVIRGITVEVRHAGDDSVSDDSVRILKGGQVGRAEHAQPAPWSTDATWVSYGGPIDLWGEEWTPADLNDAGFGVALSAAYSKNVGNTFAYVDEVRVTVSYQRTCE